MNEDAFSADSAHIADQAKNHLPNRRMASSSFMIHHSSSPIIRRACPAILGLLAFLCTAGTISDPGPVWDEPFTMVASEIYVGWLGSPSLSRQGIDGAWSVNHEHPPLAKVWMGLVRHAVQAVLPGTADVAGSRLAVAALFGLLVGLISSFAMRSGLAGGIAGGLFALFMPRLFADAHFATLDLALALAWFAAAYAFAKGIGSTRWAAAAGVIFGAALLTKINAVFIPAPLVAWGLVVHRRRALMPSILLLAIGPIVFLMGWPWLWHDTIARLGGYLLGTTVDRFIVPVYYLGMTYADRYAPWHYPLVLTLFTVPLGTLAFAAFGARRLFVRTRADGGAAAPPSDRAHLLLAVLNLAVILLVAAMPFAPKYDGVRLFLPALPFVACIAGAGFQHAWSSLRRRPLRIAAWTILAVQSLGLFIYHPYETSHYSLLCGGLPGAKRVGLETTYWCDVYSKPVFDLVNSLPPGTRVAFFPVGDFHDKFYRAAEYVREDIELVDFRKDEFDYAVLMDRQGMLLSNERAARLFSGKDGTRVLEIKRVGVTLCAIVKQ